MYQARMEMNRSFIGLGNYLYFLNACNQKEEGRMNGLNLGLPDSYNEI